MKSFVLALLAASVSAEANTACKADLENGETLTAADAATCGTVGTAKVDEAQDKAENDWCLSAVTTAAVADSAPDAGDGTPASTVCILYKKTAEEGAELREAKAATDTLSYDAWQWAAGELSADLAPAAEGDADSAKMITSALAAVATIAMVAY